MVEDLKVSPKGLPTIVEVKGHKENKAITDEGQLLKLVDLNKGPKKGLKPQSKILALLIIGVKANRSL